LAICVYALPKSSGNSSNASVSPLALKVLPEKTECFVDEKALAKVELANHSDKTFCFPPPDLECTNTRSGSAIVQGVAPPGAPQSDVFICHIDGRGWGKELVSAIKEKWIKLSPGGVYSTKLAAAQVALHTAGPWRLKASYRPPEAHFGNAAEYRQYLQEGAQQVGCVIPEHAVSAEPVTINVFAKRKEE
jgi:hypothetical protein